MLLNPVGTYNTLVRRESSGATLQHYQLSDSDKLLKLSEPQLIHPEDDNEDGTYLAGFCKDEMRYTGEVLSWAQGHG